ncbi:MAG: tetratricopeptide repeat protein [Treponemataceae bacterium]
MKKNNFMMLKKSSSVIFFICLIFFTFACSLKTERFDTELAKVDQYTRLGTRKESLKRLKKLRSLAKTPEDYLSIAKREYEFKAEKATLETLLKGVKKTNDEHLIAFLTYLTISTEDYKIAKPYFTKLYGTPYESLAAEFVLKSRNTTTSEKKLDYDLLISAFYETGEQGFLVNAALSQIAKGRMKDALKLRTERKDAPSAYPYFWAALAFDLGYFSVVFDELPYSLAQYDLAPENEKLLASAKAHTLLAADGYYGLAEIDIARGYWTEYADRFSESNPLVFYNLALTTFDIRERAKALNDCVKNFPAFYPAVARYVRDYINYNASLEYASQDSTINDVENILTESGLFSEDMIEAFLQGQFFNIEPEVLLKERVTEYDDPRFNLELLRLKIMQEPNFENHTAELWQLLEKYPEDEKVLEFAKWYFSKMLKFETAFSIAKTNNEEIDAFYEGLKASLSGETQIALNSYKAAFGKTGFEKASRVNFACTKALIGETSDAIEAYTQALDYTLDDKEKSKIYFRIAEILFDLKQYKRAKEILLQALQLDSENYLAESLLQQIR